jgi:hypothetical protein
MDFALMGRGLIIGLAIAAPVGPIGLLCAYPKTGIEPAGHHCKEVIHYG